MQRRALVTAGGTVETIDDVRVVREVQLEGPSVSAEKITHFEFGNIFRGLTGVMIAKELLARGIPTTLIGRRELRSNIEEGTPGLQFVPFYSFDDLNSAVEWEFASGQYSLFFMSAAVSDYKPVQVLGKIPSQQENLTIEFRPNPKILEKARQLAGEACTIVSFKLLSGSTDEELIETAHRQILHLRSDFCFANDLQKIDWDQQQHPITVVKPDGTHRALKGARKEVIPQAIDLVLTGEKHE